MRPWTLAALIAAGAGALPAHATRAEPPATSEPVTVPMQENGAALPPAPISISAEVMVLHATNDNTGIDRAIGPMPALSRPPFSSYNSYRLLARNSLSLPRGVAAPLKLPTGRELHVVYKDALPPHKPGQSPRFVVAASIEKPNGKSFLPLIEVNAMPGEWFWVGGQEYKGGALFIGIRISP